jgi:ubiquitin
VYSKEIKNVTSTLTELRVQDSPLKNGGGDNEKHYEKYMQKELDKRFDMDTAKNLLLE